MHPGDGCLKLLGFVERHLSEGSILFQEFHSSKAVLVVGEEVTADFDFLFTGHLFVSFQLVVC